MKNSEYLRPATSCSLKSLTFSGHPTISTGASLISPQSARNRKISRPNTAMLKPLIKQKPRLFLSGDLPKPDPEFPQWLLARSDFKSYILNSSDKPDIGKICAKPFKIREIWENRDLVAYIKSCLFFKDLTDFTISELSEKLSTVNFKAGEVMMTQGEQGLQMYIIVHGIVQVYYCDQLVDRLVETNIVGEKALESDNPRSASVYAETDVQALLLKKEDYVNTVMRHQHKQRYHIVKFLKNVEFFKDLLGAKLELIAFSTIAAHYKDNQELFAEQNQSNSLYFVKEGKIKLTVNVTITSKHRIPNKKQETHVEKKLYQKTLKIVQANDFFGEEGMLEFGTRGYKAVCCGDCEVFIVKRETLFGVLNDKEIKMLCRVHPPIPDSREAADAVRKSIKSKFVKVNAILNACNKSETLGMFGGRKNKAEGFVLGVSSAADSLLLLERESFFE